MPQRDSAPTRTWMLIIEAGWAVGNSCRTFRSRSHQGGHMACHGMEPSRVFSMKGTHSACLLQQRAGV